jgi:protein-S-isoprenylcysteine O-methyltransferase Ste14
MARILALLYGAVSYAIFFGTFLYLIGFLGNFGVPKSIDSGESGSLALALLVDGALIALFGLQHSVMARPGFKAWWTRIVPQPIERSTYVLVSSLVLIALYWAWQPIPEAVHRFEGATARGVMTGLYLAGYGVVLLSTFQIDHFDLFGLRQVALYFRRRAYAEKRFAIPFLYRFVRHPIYVGWIAAFWLTPDLTVGRVFFAAGMTAYILAAIPLEERDLAATLGGPYLRWRARTPRFFPRLGRAKDEASSAVGEQTPQAG